MKFGYAVQGEVVQRLVQSSWLLPLPHQGPLLQLGQTSLFSEKQCQDLGEGESVPPVPSAEPGLFLDLLGRDGIDLLIKAADLLDQLSVGFKDVVSEVVQYLLHRSQLNCQAFLYASPSPTCFYFFVGRAVPFLYILLGLLPYHLLAGLLDAQKLLLIYQNLKVKLRVYLLLRSDRVQGVTNQLFFSELMLKIEFAHPEPHNQIPDLLLGQRANGCLLNPLFETVKKRCKLVPGNGISNVDILQIFVQLFLVERCFLNPYEVLILLETGQNHSVLLKEPSEVRCEKAESDLQHSQFKFFLSQSKQSYFRLSLELREDFFEADLTVQKGEADQVGQQPLTKV